MADPTSRYAATPILTWIAPDGREVRYLARRILPEGGSMESATELTIGRGDRLDLIASRVLGDPLVAWRIADANNAMHPEELTAEPGARLRIPTVRW